MAPHPKNVGFPLLPEEQLGSAFAVTTQMLTILINGRSQDQIATLTSDDILIPPDLGQFGSQDFQRLPEAKQLGEDKAQELSRCLANLSVPKSLKNGCCTLGYLQKNLF
jgi:NTE family protein